MRAMHLAAIATLGMIGGIETDQRPGGTLPRPERKPQPPAAPTSNRKALLLEKAKRRAARLKDKDHE